MTVVKYSLNEINLVSWAQSTLGIKELENLHQLPDPTEFQNYVDRLNYWVNQLRQDAEKIRNECMKIKYDVLGRIFGTIQSFQFPPSFRCHLAGAGTASAFHKDGDPKYGIAVNTLNVWIPLTKVSGNNSIHIETGCQKGDYQALSLDVGEMLVFDAYNLMHGSYANDTGVSRVSLDIRFLPKEPDIARRLGVYAR